MQNYIRIRYELHKKVLDLSLPAEPFSTEVQLAYLKLVSYHNDRINLGSSSTALTKDEVSARLLELATSN